MKDFKSIIGATPELLRENRVKNVVKNASFASRNVIETKLQEFRDLQSKIDAHLDLGITNSQDLASNLRDFDAKKWTEVLYEMIPELAVLAREILIDTSVHNNLFPDNKVNGLDEDDLSFIKELNTLSI